MYRDNNAGEQQLKTEPNVIESQYLTHSFAPNQAQDPCRVKPWNDPGEMTKDNAIKGIGHTHPLFYDPDEYNAGIGCGGVKADVSLLDLAILNTLNEASSDGDKLSHIYTQADDYLSTPFRDSVKVMREGSQHESTLP